MTDFSNVIRPAIVGGGASGTMEMDTDGSSGGIILKAHDALATATVFDGRSREIVVDATLWRAIKKEALSAGIVSRLARIYTTIIILEQIQCHHSGGLWCVDIHRAAFRVIVSAADGEVVMVKVPVALIAVGGNRAEHATLKEYGAGRASGHALDSIAVFRITAFPHGPKRELGIVCLIFQHCNNGIFLGRGLVIQTGLQIAMRRIDLHRRLLKKVGGTPQLLLRRD